MGEKEKEDRAGAQMVQFVIQTYTDAEVVAKAVAKPPTCAMMTSQSFGLPFDAWSASEVSDSNSVPNSQAVSWREQMTLMAFVCVYLYAWTVNNGDMLQ